MTYKEDVDYIVEQTSVDIAVADGANNGKTFRKTSKILKVFFAEEGVSEFLCAACKEFRSPNVNSVRSHLTKHAAEEKEREHKLAAFELLPEAIRKKLLERVKNGDRATTEEPVRKRPGRTPTAKTRFGSQQILDVLLAKGSNVQELARGTGLNPSKLRDYFRGRAAIDQKSAVIISEHLNIPINQLFTPDMMANMREDG